MGNLRRAWSVVTALAVLIAAGCAQVKSPGGGPVDETPPQVVSVSPADSSVGVSPGTDVRIGFSERMTKSSVENALFISPYPEPYPRLDWSIGDCELRLRFGERLDSARTYVVTIGSEASDVHSVRMDQAVTFAFATGDSLDTGQISASVYRLQRGLPSPATGITLGLFPLADTTSPYERYALYESQTGTDGTASFRNLAPGRYRLVGWSDRQKDFRPGHDEPTAVFCSDVDLPSGGAVELPPTLMYEPDVDPPTLMYLRAIDRNHVEARFSEPVVAQDVRLITVDPDSILAIALQRGEPQATVVIWTGDQPPRATCSADLSAVDEAGNRLFSAADSTSFSSSAVSDTARPNVVEYDFPLPITGDTAGVFTFWFDDVLAEGAQDSARMLVDSVEVRGLWSLAAPNALAFEPSSPIPPGQNRWRLPLTSIRDRQGNAGADTSVSPVLRLAERSLGGFSGVVTDGDASATGPIALRLVPLQGDWNRFVCATADGAWAFDRLPPGGYVVLAWRDANGDSLLSTGSLDPFTPSERWATSDTVTVRAGWMFEDIGIRIRQ